MEPNLKNGLYIPVNIRKRKEIVEGFGKEEMVQTAFVTLIGLIVGIILFFVFSYQILLIVGVPLVFGIGAIILLRKDKTNTSSIDMIKEMIDFSKSQKKYQYKYHNIYERKVENHKDGKKVF